LFLFFNCFPVFHESQAINESCIKSSCSISSLQARYELDNGRLNISLNVTQNWNHRLIKRRLARSSLCSVQTPSNVLVLREKGQQQRKTKEKVTSVTIPSLFLSANLNSMSASMPGKSFCKTQVNENLWNNHKPKKKKKKRTFSKA
jgi:hypothetical protein